VPTHLNLLGLPGGTLPSLNGTTFLPGLSNIDAIGEDCTNVVFAPRSKESGRDRNLNEDLNQKTAIIRLLTYQSNSYKNELSIPRSWYTLLVPVIKNESRDIRKEKFYSAWSDISFLSSIWYRICVESKLQWTLATSLIERRDSISMSPSSGISKSSLDYKGYKKEAKIITR